MDEGFPFLHGLPVHLEILLTAHSMFLLNGKTKQGILGTYRQRIPIHVQKNHADPVGPGKIILECLQFVFTNELDPLINRTRLLFHDDAQPLLY